MVPQKAARRYARALYELAGEQRCLDRVLPDMASVSAALSASPELAGFLPNHTIRRSDRRRAIEALFRKGLDPLSWKFILFLETKRRLGLLGDICQAIAELHDKATGVVKVSLTTALALAEGSAEERAVRTAIANRREGAMKLSVGVDRQLIGGFMFRLGDTIYDYSVRGTLDALRRKIAN